MLILHGGAPNICLKRSTRHRRIPFTRMPARTQPSTRSRPAADPQASAATRRRLLDVALLVFSEQGFRAATVREICAKAKANIAAVNYHFGDKEGLYRAVIGEAKCHADERHPTRLASTGDPEQDLRQFVRAFVERLLQADSCAAHGKLMAWEMIEPTRALDELVRDVIRPTWMHLGTIVAANIGIDAADPRNAALLRRATASVLSQVLLYRTCRTVVERLHPDLFKDPKEIEHIVDHIVAFSLTGLKGLSKRARQAARAPMTIRRAKA